MKKKTAVILLNLGGPDKLSSVKEFLFNLFYDPAIIRLINPFRWIIAKLISSRREEKAKGIYAQMGGGSTIFPITNNQAKLLEAELNKNLAGEFKVLVSMRYWHPFASEVIKEVENYAPDEILLLPLYPQFSTTTTESSLNEFSKLLKNTKMKSVCCYFKDYNFIKAHVDLIKDKIPKEKYRILFSAHGLPEKIIKQGDPYQYQVEETVAAVVKDLDPKTDYVICYQSKVGPLKWLGPSTEEELEKAAADNIAVMIVPIAFVSDHSETLVELDIEYKQLFAEKCKKPYIRIPALNDNHHFIKALFEQAKLMIEDKPQISKNNLDIYAKEKCTGNFKDCFCKD